MAAGRKLLGLQGLRRGRFYEAAGSDGCPIDQVGGYVAPLDARPYEEEGVVEAGLHATMWFWAQEETCQE